MISEVSFDIILGGFVAGLREVKKQKTKQAILEYSERIFKEKGYSSVKTAEIAKAVEVGEGTIFNYFGSKANLFLEAVFSDFEGEKYKINLKDGINETSLTNEVINIIDFYLKKLADTEKVLIKEYFSIAFSNRKDALSPMVSLMNMDKTIMEELKKLFIILNENNQLSEKINPSIVTNCIYSCLIVQFTTYIYDDQIKYTDVMEYLKKQVELIINGSVVLS